jgi:UDP-N-acetylglucosamine 2-epimerase (hydrolysing)
MDKKILFLTGTRADFGKLKSLIQKSETIVGIEPYIFVTGMHMLEKYGMTSREVDKMNYSSVYKFINQNYHDSMDCILAKTIHGLSDYVKEIKPDMIVVHGDRVEAMAGAIVGALNNILVSHIEGGEVSGTIDELIRHSVSKMSHLHFVCNEKAKKRLVQIGEIESSIFVIGSPDLDIMTSTSLPSLTQVKERYAIPFEQYSVFMYHPVTTCVDLLPLHIKESVDAMIESNDNYVVIYPNNDHGTEIIIKELDRLRNHERFKVYPSIRFEHFLTLIKMSEYMLGNSSAGIREAPFYGLPTINLGTRQQGRSNAESILHCKENKAEIMTMIQRAKSSVFKPSQEFGVGNSDKLFAETLANGSIWSTSKQKIFNDIDVN